MNRSRFYSFASFSVLLIALIFNGCVSQRAVFINPRTAQQAVCAHWGWGWLGVPAAMIDQSRCESSQKSLGLMSLSQYEKTEGPKFDGPTQSGITIAHPPVWKLNSEWAYKIGEKEKLLKVEGEDIIATSSVYRLLGEDGGKIYHRKDLALKAIVDAGGAKTEYDPPIHSYDWPLMVGKRWIYKGKSEASTGTVPLYSTYEVKGVGRVRVPAGEFDVFYILTTSDQGARVAERWYSPEVQQYVKSVTYTAGGADTELLQRYSLGADVADTAVAMLPSAKPDGSTLQSKLEQLRELHKDGLITNNEYAQKKAELLKGL